MNERLKELRKSLDLSMEAFGAQIGLNKASISRMEAGAMEVSERTARTICLRFHVREEWLRYGIGEMYESAAPDDVDLFLKSKDITGVEADLFKAYISLPKDLREAVIDCFTKYFADKQAEKVADSPESRKDSAGNDG